MRKKIFLSLLVVFCLFMITGCNKNAVVKGKWKAIPANQKVYNDDGKIVGGKEDYFLECDGKGYYDLKDSSGDLVNAGYKVSDSKVTFYDEGQKVLAICKISDNELDCSEKSYYAFKYTKIS